MMHVPDPYITKRISKIFTLFSEPRVSKTLENITGYFYDIIDQAWTEAFPEEVLEYTPQSGALGTIQEEGVANLTEEITNFQEQQPGWTTSIGSGSDATMNLGNNSDSALGSFLGRPTRIADVSWAVGQPLFFQINPWSLFLSDPRVAEKVANFELYRSKLHVKMVISGTGFHYGRALASYNPYFGYDQVTVQRNFLQADLVQASQKPHFFLNPTTNSGGQLDLPFFWHKNYLSLSTTDKDDMGEITVKSFGDLQHANGGDDPVIVTIYAWASDVVLTMPTAENALTVANYTPQSGKLNSGDEYGKGIISAPASAIAQAAGALKSVPAIAPYARATEMVAKGVGDLATHWGYSRPPIVTDIVQQKPLPAGNLANTDAADAVMKLSLDSKQELTIDSRTVGLDGEDQMDITRFCQRESYLTSFTMNSIEGPDTMLWNCRVTPNLYRVEGEELHPTPMSYMAVPFGKWQGSIKYRFQIVKSAFHKGKLLIRWDPRAHGSDIQYNTVYSRVIDIAECDDFEIVVGWGQSLPFLDTSAIALTPELYSDTNRLALDNNSRYNGTIEVNVVNSLVAPSTDTPIQFNVFVSACEDIKFGEPSPTQMKALSIFPEPAVLARYTPQSGIVDSAAIAGTSEGGTDAPTNPDAILPIASGASVADQTMNVFFGEAPKSIRELNRRYVLHRTDVFYGPSGVNNVKLVQLRDKGLGYWNGWDPNGIDTESATACNIVIPTYANFFAPCYAGWRGSTRTKYTFSGNLDSKPTVSRFGYSTASRFQENSYNLDDAAKATKRLTFGNGQFTSGGAASTNLGINDTIEVETPFYNAVRFSPARLPQGDYANGAHSNNVQFSIADYNTTPDPIGSACAIKSWKSVGEDFTFFFFTGCPILYRYEIIPAT